MKATKTIVAGGCGLGNTYDFNSNGNEYWSDRDQAPGSRTRGGTGFDLACFINNSTCKQVYEEMNSTKRLIFQSPNRINRHSGRPFFFAVFDDRKTNKAVSSVPSLEAKWPWKRTA